VFIFIKVCVIENSIVLSMICYTETQKIQERVFVKIAASEPVARRKRATHAGEVSHAISRKKLHGKI